MKREGTHILQILGTKLYVTANQLEIKYENEEFRKIHASKVDNIDSTWKQFTKTYKEKI